MPVYSHKWRPIPQPVQTEVLNAEGAGRLLGVSPRFVLRLARTHRLPGRKLGKEWRFSRERLLAWLCDAEPRPRRAKARRHARRRRTVLRKRSRP